MNDEQGTDRTDEAIDRLIERQPYEPEKMGRPLTPLIVYGLLVVVFTIGALVDIHRTRKDEELQSTVDRLQTNVDRLRDRVEELELETAALHEEIGAAHATTNELDDHTSDLFREVFDQLEEGGDL